MPSSGRGTKTSGPQPGGGPPPARPWATSTGRKRQRSLRRPASRTCEASLVVSASSYPCLLESEQKTKGHQGAARRTPTSGMAARNM
eukprot:10253491-Lingulodinium_polyedra.AAC.1